MRSFSHIAMNEVLAPVRGSDDPGPGWMAVPDRPYQEGPSPPGWRLPTFPGRAIPAGMVVPKFPGTLVPSSRSDGTLYAMRESLLTRSPQASGTAPWRRLPKRRRTPGSRASGPKRVRQSGAGRREGEEKAAEQGHFTGRERALSRPRRLSGRCSRERQKLTEGRR